MPGEPAETLLGVGAIGAGALLLYCAYKNVSPFGLVKQAITTGDLDPSKVPPLIPGTITGTLSDRILGPDVRKALADIGAKDPALSADIMKELVKFSVGSPSQSATPYSETKHFFDLMSQARVEGFGSQADVIEKWVNDYVKPASSTTAPGTRTI